MPRRSILSASEKQSLIALPDKQAEFIRCYSLSEADISVIKQRRGDANRIGFAIQLCYMRYPGIILGPNEYPDSDLLNFTSQQLSIAPTSWNEYSFREKTRREHILELQQLFGYTSFSHLNHEQYVNYLTTLAIDTDKGIIVAEQLINYLRSQRILLPAINAIEQICAEAINQANKTIYSRLTDDLSQNHLEKLDELLQIRNGLNLTHLGWLRQSPLKPNSRHMLSHIDRLQYCLDINLPDGIERRIHQNRLLKIAREGGQMQAADLAKFEPKRRYATLVALVIESRATIIDEIIDLHDRIIGKIFNKAKNKHQQVFSASGKSINEKVQKFVDGYNKIKLKIIQMFYTMLFGLIILWFLNKKSDTLNNEKGLLKMPFLGVGILVSAFIIYYGIAHEPLIDFRDYKIGTDLNLEKQKIAANPSEYKTSYTMKNTKTGEEKVVGQDDFVNQKEYWEEGTPWQIQKGKEVSVLVKQGYQSSIDKFKLEDENGNDITEQILHLPKVVIFFSYAPEKIKENDKNFLEYGIEDFIFNYKELNPKSEFYGVSTQKSFFKKVKSLTMDGTAIKTIARSNPFVLILENGKIVEKKSLEDFLKH